MDQDGDSRGQGIGSTIDFDSMSIVYDGGFAVPIIAMFDRFDEETDDHNEAEYILVEWPGEGLVTAISIEDIKSDGRVQVEDRPH
ncbi:hypothetical protein [Bradyrhizobium sp. SZCCHNR1093]|uniref:hypothetical protein n=1 Tax=Bradyrhizobium sp. SZCCHNR1093 TaxID=3057368 RepID=UPI0028E830CD|nr:hypothetical protein [Bradyrhizobium sp. SZCCHNR1093]